MSKKRNGNSPQKQTQKRSAVFLTDPAAYDVICCSGYTRLDKNPEIVAGCRKIAELISTMTIHLMANTDKGDQRIVNELSRKVDIAPNRFMTRKTWMEAIVMNLLLYGTGNSVVQPITSNGVLGDMIPVDPETVSFTPDSYGYRISIGGIDYDPDNLLHFVFNPDSHYPWKGNGITAAIKDVANNLKQAAATEKSFMESKWKPSIIVKVDGLIDEFSTKAGRKKLLEEYIETDEVGTPWVIPADQFAIEVH